MLAAVPRVLEILRTYLETAVLNIVQAVKPSLDQLTGSAQLRTFVRAHIQEQLKPLSLLLLVNPLV